MLRPLRDHGIKMNKEALESDRTVFKAQSVHSSFLGPNYISKTGPIIPTNEAQGMANRG